MNCTRCEGTGFLNLHQLPEDILEQFEAYGVAPVLKWIRNTYDHDVSVCDCCGDGEEWYGEPGEHYTSKDPPGFYGPYASNGGFCMCH